MSAAKEDTFEFVALRLPETNATSNGVILHRGVGKHRLANAICELAHATRTNSTWSNSVPRQVASCRTRLDDMGHTHIASCLPSLDTLGNSVTGRGGHVERRADAELCASIGCAPRRQASPTAGKCPNLPYAPRLGAVGISYLSGSQASSTMRRFFSALKHVSDIMFHSFQMGSHASAGAFWESWEIERSRNALFASPLMPSLLLELKWNPGRSPHSDQQVGQPTMIVAKVSYRGCADGGRSARSRRHPATNASPGITSTFQLCSVNVALAEHEEMTSLTVFHGNVMHGAEGNLDATVPLVPAEAVQESSSPDRQFVHCLTKELLLCDGVFSIGTWNPDGVLAAYAKYGGDDAFRLSLDGDPTAQWLRLLLEEELGMQTDVAVACAVLYSWPGTAWRELVLKASTLENNPDSSTRPWHVLHWSDHGCISHATADFLLKAPMVQVRAHLNANPPTLGNACSQNMDCAILPVVGAHSRGLCGVQPGIVSVNTIRWELGVQRGVPLTAADIKCLDYTHQVKRLIIYDDGQRVAWFNDDAPQSDEEVILLLSESAVSSTPGSVSNDHPPPLSECSWGGKRAAISAEVIDIQRDDVTTPNEYRRKHLGMEPLPHSDMSLPFPFTTDTAVHTSTKFTTLKPIKSGPRRSLERCFGDVDCCHMLSSPLVSMDLSIDVRKLGPHVDVRILGVFEKMSFIACTSAPSMMVDLLKRSYLANLLPSPLMLSMADFNPVIKRYETYGNHFCVYLGCPNPADHHPNSSPVRLPLTSTLSTSLSCTGWVRLRLQLKTDTSGPGLFEYTQCPLCEPPRLDICIHNRQCKSEKNILFRKGRITGDFWPHQEVDPSARALIALSCSMGNSFWYCRESWLADESGFHSVPNASRLDEELQAWRLPDYAVSGIDHAVDRRLMQHVRTLMMHAQHTFNRSPGLLGGGALSSSVIIIETTPEHLNVLFCSNDTLRCLLVAMKSARSSVFVDGMSGPVSTMANTNNVLLRPMITCICVSSPCKGGPVGLVSLQVHTDLSATPQRRMFEHLVHGVVALGPGVYGKECVRGEHIVRALGVLTSDLGADLILGWNVIFENWVASDCYTKVRELVLQLPLGKGATWATVKRTILHFCSGLLSLRRTDDSFLSAIAVLRQCVIFHFFDKFHAQRALSEATTTASGGAPTAGTQSGDVALGPQGPKRTKAALTQLHPAFGNLLPTLGHWASSNLTVDFINLENAVEAVASLLLRKQSISIHFAVNVDNVQSLDDVVRLVENLVSSSTRGQPEGHELDNDTDDADSDCGGSPHMHGGKSSAAGCCSTQDDKTPPPGRRYDPRCDVVEVDGGGVSDTSSDSASGISSNPSIEYMGPIRCESLRLFFWVQIPALHACKGDKVDALQRGAKLLLSPAWMGVHTSNAFTTSRRPRMCIELPCSISSSADPSDTAIQNYVLTSVTFSESKYKQQASAIGKYIERYLYPRLAEQSYHCCLWLTCFESSEAPVLQKRIGSTLHETTNRLLRTTWIMVLPARAVHKITKNEGVDLEVFTTLLLGNDTYVGLLKDVSLQFMAKMQGTHKFHALPHVTTRYTLPHRYHTVTTRYHTIPHVTTRYHNDTTP